MKRQKTPKEAAKQTREEFILANLGLVITIAGDFKNKGLDWEDLIQEGNIGLMQAVDKFDPGKGVEFHKFAKHRIRGAMKDAINRNRIIRVPPRVMAARKKARKKEET